MDHLAIGSRETLRAITACASSRRRVLRVLVRTWLGFGFGLGLGLGLGFGFGLGLGFGVRARVGVRGVGAHGGGGGGALLDGGCGRLERGEAELRLVGEALEERLAPLLRGRGRG